MGKCKISVTIDSELAESIEKFVEDGRYRNRSHVIEYGLKKLMEVEK